MKMKRGGARIGRLTRRLAQGLAWGSAGVVAVVLLVDASVPYVGPRLASTRPYVWLRVPRAVVTFDGKPAAVPVYRAPDGDLLVWMNGAVVISPKGGWTGMSVGTLWDDIPETNHILVARRFALVMDDNYRPGVLGSGIPEDHGDVTVRPGLFEFQEVDSPQRVVRVSL